MIDQNNETVETVNDDSTPVIFADRTKKIIENTDNKFKKVLLIFVFYIANIFVDFGKSCKRNPSKIAGLLIAIPGILIGFLLGVHIPAVAGTIRLKYANVCLFAMVLLGAVNIFNAASVIGKRNLGSAIVTTIVTALIIFCGIVYIVEFFNSISYMTDPSRAGTYTVPSEAYQSIIAVILSLLCCIAGNVLAFVFRDVTYEKDRS